MMKGFENYEKLVQVYYCTVELKKQGTPPPYYIYIYTVPTPLTSKPSAIYGNNPLILREEYIMQLLNAISATITVGLNSVIKALSATDDVLDVVNIQTLKTKNDILEESDITQEMLDDKYRRTLTPLKLK